MERIIKGRGKVFGKEMGKKKGSEWFDISLYTCSDQLK